MQNFFWSSLARRLSSTRSAVSVIMDSPKKAVIRVLKDENRMEMTIDYVNPHRALNRSFSLNRLLSENIQQLITRLSTNIDRASEKQLRKIKKKNKEVSESDWKVDIKITHNGEIVDPEVTCEKLLELSNVELVVGDQVFLFDVDPPVVRTLKLPSSIMAGFPVYPGKLEVENCKSNQCQFTWYKSGKSLKTAPSADTPPESWSLVGSGFYHVTTNEDVGTWLKMECTPQSDGREGKAQAVVSTQVVEAGPGPCPFEIRHEFTRKRMDHSGIRVVTYNILADLYADSDYTRTVLHPYCPPYALAIDYRKQLIIKELMGYNADIMCLQEVDQKIFDWDLEPTLNSLGYAGLFHKKGGQVSEGLSCFFHTEKFRLIESRSYLLSEELPINPLLIDIWNVVQSNEKLSKRILERTTTLQLVAVETIDRSKRLIIANTHLYFHPDADHIRLLQSTIGLRLAHDLLRQQTVPGSAETALIFCGDFNSCPGYGVFELMTKQEIRHDYEAWASNAEEAVAGLSVNNPIAMGSACGTPEFTNYTSGFSGCLDYIFYQSSKFQVDQVIPLPSLEEVTQHTALPSIVFPSDHIALIADLKWI